MKFQELLAGEQINWNRVKLVRHNLTNKVVAAHYERGYLEQYQTVQLPTRFQNCDMLISFLGTEGTNGVFQGCYRVGQFRPYRRAEFPEDFPETGKEGVDVVWELTKMDLLADMKDRIVIDWGKGTLNWCQRGTIEKELLEIRPVVSEIEFTSYEKVVLSFETLRNIVLHAAKHKIWEQKLSAVAGVYLITDTKTGRHYVGSASGEQGGIWGRWSEYARTKHGGNKRLKELIAADSDYCSNFQYSILEVFPIKRDRHEVLEYEQLYKRKLWSIQFGLNDN